MGFIPDFRVESKWFEMGGIYFGEEEAFKIQRSIAVFIYYLIYFFNKKEIMSY